MRRKANILYWAATGAMVGFGLIGLMSIGAPFLLVGMVMALVLLQHLLRQRSGRLRLCWS